MVFPVSQELLPISEHSPSPVFLNTQLSPTHLNLSQAGSYLLCLTPLWQQFWPKAHCLCKVFQGLWLTALSNTLHLGPCRTHIPPGAGTGGSGLQNYGVTGEHSHITHNCLSLFLSSSFATNRSAHHCRSPFPGPLSLRRP